MIQRDSFVFYRSYFNAIETLPDASQLKLYRAIVQMSLNGKEPKLPGILKGMFELILPQIKANQKRYKNGLKGKEFGVKGKEYGVLGGRPKSRLSPPEFPPITPEEPPKSPA